MERVQKHNQLVFMITDRPKGLQIFVSTNYFSREAGKNALKARGKQPCRLQYSVESSGTLSYKHVEPGKRDKTSSK